MGLEDAPDGPPKGWPAADRAACCEQVKHATAEMPRVSPAAASLQRMGCMLPSGR
jgi:hypothetical protein